MPEVAPFDRNSARFSKKEILIDGSVVASLSIFFCFLILPCSKFVDTIAFFNFAAARDIVQKGLFKGITNLPYTVLGERGPDHQLLFHLLASPFTVFDDQFLGLKLGAVFFAVVSTSSFYFLLKMLRVPLAWLFVLLLLASSRGFVYNISIFGVESLVVPLILFSAVSVVRDRKLLAGIVGLLFSWTYHGALICVPIALIGIVAARVAGGKWIRKASLSLCVGLMIGQLVNPFLPNSMEYLFFHLAYKTSNPWMLDVGRDWDQPTAWFLTKELWLPNLVIAALALFFALRQQRIKADTLAFCLTWLLCLALAARQMRFLEYAASTGVVLISLAFRDTGISLNKKATVATAALLASFAFANMVKASEMIDQDNGPDSFKEAANFLDSNTKKNEVVLNLHWRDYPILYYQNSKNRYAAGLDPYYLAYASPNRFYLLKMLENGKRMPPNLVKKLSRAFKCRYVVSRPSDWANLSRYREFRPVFASSDAVVWMIDI